MGGFDVPAQAVDASGPSIRQENEITKASLVLLSFLAPDDRGLALKESPLMAKVSPIVRVTSRENIAFYATLSGETSTKTALHLKRGNEPGRGLEIIQAVHLLGFCKISCAIEVGRVGLEPTTEGL